MTTDEPAQTSGELRAEAERHIAEHSLGEASADRPALAHPRVRARRAGRPARAARRRHGHGGRASGAIADHRRRAGRGRRRRDLDGRWLLPGEPVRGAAVPLRDRRGRAARSSSSPSARPPSSPSCSSAKGCLASRPSRSREGSPRTRTSSCAPRSRRSSESRRTAGGAALGDAVVVGVTYLVAAVVPLWPYFLFTLQRRARRQPRLHVPGAVRRRGREGSRDPALARAVGPPGAAHRLGERRRGVRHRAHRDEPGGLGPAVAGRPPAASLPRATIAVGSERQLLSLPHSRRPRAPPWPRRGRPAPAGALPRRRRAPARLRRTRPARPRGRRSAG